MRWLISAIGVAGALLLIAASMTMNWSFWTEQGANAPTANILGAVSIGIDVFKAILPLVVAWAWNERYRLGWMIGTVFLCGCLAFSFFSAIGFAASSRGVVTGDREADAHRLAVIERELGEVEARKAMLGVVRPRTVVEEAIATAKQDRRWSSSKECTDATLEPSRVFCVGLGQLRTELASASEFERLGERAAVLKVEIDKLVSAGARREPDSQAGTLARMSGLAVERVQGGIVVLLAVLVEAGAAFGLLLATLPLRGRRKGQRDQGSGRRPNRPPPPSRPSGPARRAKPTRLVRTENGLMIE